MSDAFSTLIVPSSWTESRHFMRPLMLYIMPVRRAAANSSPRTLFSFCAITVSRSSILFTICANSTSPALVWPTWPQSRPAPALAWPSAECCLTARQFSGLKGDHDELSPKMFVCYRIPWHLSMTKASSNCMNAKYICSLRLQCLGVWIL